MKLTLQTSFCFSGNIWSLALDDIRVHIVAHAGWRLSLAVGVDPGVVGKERFLRLSQDNERGGGSIYPTSSSSLLLLVVVREPLGQSRERWGRWEVGTGVRTGKPVKR